MNHEIKNWLSLVFFICFISSLGILSRQHFSSNYLLQNKGKTKIFFETQKKSILAVTIRDLLAIDGISRSKAVAIVSFIKENPQAHFRDIEEIKGIGEKTMAKLAGFFY